MRTRSWAATSSAALTLLLAACSTTSGASSSTGTSSSTSGSTPGSMPGMSMPASSPHLSGSSSTQSGMAGMAMGSGTGRAATLNGYSLDLHHTPMPDMAAPVTFTISRNGWPVTAFDPEQTKLMHFYLIRADLTGFQHLHPTMSGEGTWSATPAALAGGQYRVYVQFIPHAGAAAGALVLSRPVTVTGPSAPPTSVPEAAGSTDADGYTLTLDGAPRVGVETPIHITITKAGRPVTDLQPYLDTYAHVTAIHHGDLAFAHLHPDGTANGDHGGPTLTVHADLPEPGVYRMFVQFQTGGKLHTAPITIRAA